MKSNKEIIQPLAEVFGFPINNNSVRAKRYRENKLCPFNNIVSNCTKNSIEFPLGVCSLNHKGSPVIICPIRFREDWTIISDAAKFIFDKKATWTHVGEVRLRDKHGKAAGNIDYVLVSYDDKGRILDFGCLKYKRYIFPAISPVRSKPIWKSQYLHLVGQTPSNTPNPIIFLLPENGLFHKSSLKVQS